MARFNFPNNPAVNDEIQVGNRKLKWDGNRWKFVPISLASFATTEAIDSRISELVTNAPETLDTIDELAAAINNDPDFYNTMVNMMQNSSQSFSYTATLSNSNWSGTEPSTQTVNVTDILETDNPTIDVTFSNVYSTDTARVIEWNKVYRITTQNGQITAYATEVPLVDLPIQIKGVR